MGPFWTGQEDRVVVSVADVDMPDLRLDAGTWEEQRQLLLELHDNGDWIVRTPLGYVITRYDDVDAMLRDDRWYSAIGLVTDMRGSNDPELKRRSGRIILDTEGDDYRRIRNLVRPAFSPRSAERMRSFMVEIVNELLDPVCARGSAEFVGEVSEPYVIPVICEMLGAPRDHWKMFRRLTTDILRIFNANLERDGPAIIAALTEIEAYMTELISERRSQPRDDLLSELIAVEEAGDRLSTEELLALVNSLLLAGVDTTRNQLALGVVLFAQHPDQLQLIADDPSLAPGAVSEVMRYLGALRGLARYASESITYNGIEFPAYTIILPSLVGANYDNERFAQSVRFDITRQSRASHLTFGSGIHYCWGAHIARAELEEAFVTVARRMPNLCLDGEVQWKPLSDGIWGPAAVPIRFMPGH